MTVSAVVIANSLCFAGEAEDRAATSAAPVLDSWTTPEGFYENLSRPLMSGDTPLYTLDGSASAPSRINCPGTRTALELVIGRGPTGDLNFLSAACDLDADGTLDHVLSLDSTPVSGVCANGFISCTPGTWSDCTWYQWEVTGGRLRFQPVGTQELGGCFCINSYCTAAPFMNMKNEILKALGGGIIAAMAQNNSGIAIGTSEIEGNIIRYFGQNSGDCAVTAGNYSLLGQSSPDDALGNPALLPVMSEQEVIKQEADPDSYYSLITSSSVFDQYATHTCEKRRSIYFDPTDCEVKETLNDSCQMLERDSSCELRRETLYDRDDNPVVTVDNTLSTGLTPIVTCRSLDDRDISDCVLQNGGGSGAMSATFLSCGSNCVNLVIGQVGDNYWCGSCVIKEANHLIDIKMPELIQSVMLIRAKWDDYMQILVNDDLAWCGPDHCTTLPPSGAPCERSTSWDWNLNHDMLSFFQGQHQAKIKVRVAVAGCGEGYAFIQFRMKPLSEYPVCHEWWRMEREYVCKNDPVDFNIDTTRMDSVTDSLVPVGNSFSYTDQRHDEAGAVVVDTGSIGIDVTEGGHCIYACKLAVLSENTQADGYRVATDYERNPATSMYIYRTCRDGICPHGAGESVVKECQCLNEFNETVAAVETLRQAGIDMICSDGVMK